MTGPAQGGDLSSMGHCQGGIATRRSEIPVQTQKQQSVTQQNRWKSEALLTNRKTTEDAFNWFSNRLGLSHVLIRCHISPSREEMRNGEKKRELEGLACD